MAGKEINESDLYKWYVVADADDNEIVARELARQKLAVESETVSFRDNLGNSHSGWRVEHSFITSLEKARKKFNMKFKVFVQEGKGQIREFPVFKKRPSKKALQAAKDLKEMKQRKTAKK